MRRPKERDDWIVAVLDRSVKSIRRSPESLLSQKFLDAFDAGLHAAQALGRCQIPANLRTSLFKECVEHRAARRDRFACKR